MCIRDRDTIPLLRSITAECCRNMSHPINTLNGSPVATKNPIGIVTLLFVRSSDTCFLTDLFCRPVAPIIIILFTGKEAVSYTHLDVYKRQTISSIFLVVALLIA